MTCGAVTHFHSCMLTLAVNAETSPVSSSPTGSLEQMEFQPQGNIFWVFLAGDAVLCSFKPQSTTKPSIIEAKSLGSLK